MRAVLFCKITAWNCLLSACLGHLGRHDTRRNDLWTNFSQQDETWPEFSTLAVGILLPYTLAFFSNRTAWLKFENLAQKHSQHRLIFAIKVGLNWKHQAKLWSVSVERKVSYSWCEQNVTIQGGGQLGQYDNTWANVIKFFASLSYDFSK